MIDIPRVVFGEGVDAKQLTLLQVGVRAVVVFFSTLVMVRVANKRFIAKKTAFDFILSVILASMMARAINGSERLVQTIFGGFILAFLHRMLAWIACRYPALAKHIKGTSQDLIVDGKVDRATMDRHHLGDDDLNEELRLNGIERAEEVALARLERSGDVSVIKKAE